MKKAACHSFAVAAALVLLCVFSGSARAGGQVAEGLRQRAAAGEELRLIVTFAVPGLADYQERSRRAAKALPGRELAFAEKKRARAADSDLALAIKTRADKLAAGLGLRRQLRRVFKTVPQAVLTVDKAGLDSLAADRRVLRIVEDLPFFLPADGPAEDALPVVEAESWGVNAVNAPRAWARGFDGTGWYVAVLDTGLRASHEMFSGKDIVEACFSSCEYGQSECTCPGGVEEAFGPGSAAPYNNDSHGTHVSGIAVGNQPGGNNKGVAPGAGLIAVQVYSFFPAYYDLASWESDQIEGLEHVYSLRSSYPIASVNMSLGDGRAYTDCYWDPRAPIMENLTAAGIAVCVSTGNESYCDSVSGPACVSSAIAVGGSDQGGFSYWASNWHPLLQDIFAPGVSISSASAWADDGYTMKTGTSMAAPHVAGAWAIFRQLRPEWSVEEIRSLMRDAGSPILSWCDTEPDTGPQVDVGAVVEDYLDHNALPTADAGPDGSVDEGALYVLDGSASSSNCSRGLLYSWTQASGATLALSNPDSVTTTFIAPEAPWTGMDLVFTLRVTNDLSGLSDAVQVTVSVLDLDRYKGPTADAGADLSARTGETVFLDASGSVENSKSGLGLFYSWVQARGVAAALSDPHAATPTFVAPLADGESELVFDLVVVDKLNNLADQDSVSVKVLSDMNPPAPGCLPAAWINGETLCFTARGGNGAFVSLLALDPLAPQDISNPAGRPENVSYLFDSAIRCEAGAVVSVDILLPSAAVSWAGWFSYGDAEGFAPFPAVFSSDLTRVAIRLTDGGPGDRDGTADGTILHASGLGWAAPQALQPPPAPGKKSGGSCFMDSLQ